jgi:CRISPR-associated protein Csm4
LKFITSLHTGKDSGSAGLEDSQTFIHSDTLFSALFIESRKIQQSDYFFDIAQKGKITISSLLPYCGNELFLPKPIYAHRTDITSVSSEKYKLFKKLQYIPLSMFEQYIASLKGGDIFDAQKAQNLLNMVSYIETRTNVFINPPNDSLPYYVGVTTFASSCGLYFIAGFETEKEQSLLEQLINQLSYSGIGGKRSSGFGKFEISEKILLNEKAALPYNSLHKILSGKHSTYMCMNLSLARDDELDMAVQNGYFALVRRGGFIQSERYSDTHTKKKLMYVFGEGSCFKYAYNGYIADVSQNGSHPVYRFLKPFFLGVDL